MHKQFPGPVTAIIPNLSLHILTTYLCEVIFGVVNDHSYLQQLNMSRKQFVSSIYRCNSDHLGAVDKDDCLFENDSEYEGEWPNVYRPYDGFVFMVF